MTINTKNRKISEEYNLPSPSFEGERYEYETKAVYPQSEVFWHKASGHSIWDTEKNKWIDMTSGIFVANAGHANPQIKQAIKNQLDSDLIFAYTYDTTIRTKLAKKLVEISPDHLSKVIFMNSGTEATDVAYRLIKTWAKKNNKKYIVCFRGSYHGRALSCDLMCGDENSSSWSNIDDNDIIFLDFPYREGDKFDPSIFEDPSQIAAFMLETYQGWGACMYPAEYINQLYGFARNIGALVCFDEVQAGFYRMGSLYGYQSYNDSFKPDLVCLGKGLTSSLPLSAVLGTKEIIDIDKDANVSSTHSGNALTCAAALANIDFLTSKSFQKGLAEKCELFENLCLSMSKIDIVEKVYCRGMVGALIIDNTVNADRVVDKCIQRGVLPVRTSRESIKLGPPLTIDIEAIEEAFQAIEQCIKEVSSGK